MSRICYNGNMVDNTAALKTFLAQTSNPLIKHLYRIGDPHDPNVIYATDFDSPLLYLPVGTFYPAVISRSALKFSVGFDDMSCTIDWQPSNRVFTKNRGTANPLQLAMQHYYDNLPVKIWKVYMQTRGDCNTIGAVEWFAGVVGHCVVSRSSLTFEVKSYLYLLSQNIPANVVESTNTLSGYTGAQPPPGETNQPTFTTFIGSTEGVVYGDCINHPNKIYDANTFNQGFLVFLGGPGATLAGYWAGIALQTTFVDGNGNHHNQFQLYNGLPWPPTPGVDNFYVSATPPVNLDAAASSGFYFVPDPETAA